MSTKKKMIVSITSMCVVLLVAVVSVIAVWAATSASVKSNINITYTIKNIEGTMKMRVADRNKTNDSEVTWTTLKTNNGAGEEMLTFTGEEPTDLGEYFAGGQFGLQGNFSSQEYSGIRPMTVVEVQLTNSSSTSYFAKIHTDLPTHSGEILEVFIVRDFFATGTEVVPALSEYDALVGQTSTDKETISANDFVSTPYEIKNDGTYCLYFCMVSNSLPGSQYDDVTLDLSFGIELYNAYAG